MQKPIAAPVPPPFHAPIIRIELGFQPSRAFLRRLRSPALEAFLLCNIGFWTAFAIADLWCRYG